ALKAVTRLQLTDDHAVDPAMAAYVEAACRRASRRSLHNVTLSFVADRRDLTEAVRDVVVPTLMVMSRERADWTPELARTVCAAMRTADVVELSGFRTLAAVEQPAALVEAIRAFWHRHPSSRLAD
ncbi:alpha/beta fold hydrolase, partial [Microbacterium sp.]|uniref:alpha/beta fold hydrolase n=1 Tax=Microbacterium sp. TaxID=51671 RepID=UPI003C7173B3